MKLIIIKYSAHGIMKKRKWDLNWWAGVDYGDMNVQIEE